MYNTEYSPLDYLKRRRRYYEKRLSSRRNMLREGSKYRRYEGESPLFRTEEEKVENLKESIQYILNRIHEYNTAIRILEDRKHYLIKKLKN